MIKYINKFIPPRRFAVPLLGLVVVIGAIAQRAQPVLSKQMTRLQANSSSKVLDKQVPNYTLLAQKSDTTSQSISKEARLRRALNNSSPQSKSVVVRISPGETYTWMQGNIYSNSKDLVKDKRSQLNTLKTTIENKASIKRGIQKKNFPKDDGVFLYGSSPQPGQFGEGYIVFEKRGGKVMGGMYMPASEFNCFQGTLDRSGEIAMTVKGYAGDVSLNQVASRDRLSRANDSELTNYAYSVTLQDYDRVVMVGNDDRRILKACKDNFREF
ncbi:MAG: hypothetical protein AAFW70_30575 [Cyanobacteria bacterium J06635_10]